MGMKAAVLVSRGKILDRPLHVEDVTRPEPGAGQVLLRVLACGVCRTDLHIVEGEIPSLRSPLIPGHQIAGELLAARPPSFRSARAWASPGLAVRTGSAGTAETIPRTFAILRRSPGTA